MYLFTEPQSWAKVQEHDERWYELATGQLGISKPILQTYLSHGDSLLLANSISICQRTSVAYSEHDWQCDVYSRSKTLQLVSRFNVQETLPELQHEFCDLWNELVLKAGNRRSTNVSIYILKHVRNIYCDLHQGTGAAPTLFSSTTSDDDVILLYPNSYPLCKIARHHPKPTLSEEVGANESFPDEDSTSVTSETLTVTSVHPPRFEYPFPQASPCLPGGTVAPPHKAALEDMSNSRYLAQESCHRVLRLCNELVGDALKQESPG